MDINLVKDYIIPLVPTVITLVVLLWARVKMMGKEEARDETSKANDAQRATNVQEIRDALKGIEVNYRAVLLQVAQINMALFGVAGTNGLRQEVKDLGVHVARIDNRLSVQESHDE